jgi:hypothetical protein
MNEIEIPELMENPVVPLYKDINELEVNYEYLTKAF